MKTTLIKFWCLVVSVTFLMTSCLGDGDSSFQKTNDFAYATTVEGQLCLATLNGGWVYTDDMSQFSAGNCYSVSYKISQGVNSNGLYYADYLTRTATYSTKHSLVIGEPYSDIDINTQQDSIHVLAINPEGWSANEYFGNNWLFAYSASTTDGDNVKAYFYYDENNQIDQSGTTVSLADKKMIVDIRFIKIDGNGGGSTVSNVFYGIGNFTSLKMLPVEIGSGSYTDVAIQFRYPKYQSNSTEPIMTYFGTWTDSSTGGSSTYYIRYFE